MLIFKQETQLSLTGCEGHQQEQAETILKVDQGHDNDTYHCVLVVGIYLVSLLRHSMSNTGVTLPSGLWLIQGQWKMAPFDKSHTTYK